MKESARGADIKDAILADSMLYLSLALVFFYLWRNSMKLKENKFQILAWGLSAVLVICLICIVISDRKKAAERNLQLLQEAQQSEKAYAEIVEQQAEIYEKLYADLEIPEFICWGDNLMRGENGGSFTNSLNTTIDKNLFKYLTNSFHNVIEDGKHSAPSVSINNMGVINENMPQILARAGVNKVFLSEGINIPSSKDPVLVKLVNEETRDNNDREELLFARQNSDQFGKVIISGIDGKLDTTEEWYDSIHPRYAFIRDHEGDYQFVEAGTEVELESASKFLGDIPIFFFENNSGQSVGSFMNDLIRLVARYASSGTLEENEETDEGDQEDNNNQSDIDQNETAYDLPYIVICRTKEGSDLDNALKNEFGDNYIRNDQYSSEMYGNAFNALAKNIYEILDEQGCFTNIKEKIMKAVEEVNDL